MYEIALNQIIDANTYAAKPFNGSYSVRSILQATLMDAADEARAFVQPLQASGLPEDEILAQLDVDARFEAWLAAVRAGLDEAGVSHITQ